MVLRVEKCENAAVSSHRLYHRDNGDLSDPVAGRQLTEAE